MPNSSGLEFYIFKLHAIITGVTFYLFGPISRRVVKYRGFALQEKNVVGLFCIVSHLQFGLGKNLYIIKTKECTVLSNFLRAEKKMRYLANMG